MLNVVQWPLYSAVLRTGGRQWQEGRPPTSSSATTGPSENVPVISEYVYVITEISFNEAPLGRLRGSRPGFDVLMMPLRCSGQ